jgi:hypothetical protein
MLLADLNRLGHSLAFEHATSVIDSNCVEVSDQVPEYTPHWFEIVPDSEITKDAVLYLKARGLLERHPKNQNWITMFSESEASR